MASRYFGVFEENERITLMGLAGRLSPFLEPLAEAWARSIPLEAAAEKLPAMRKVLEGLTSAVLSGFFGQLAALGPEAALQFHHDYLERLISKQLGSPVGEKVTIEHFLTSARTARSLLTRTVGNLAIEDKASVEWVLLCFAHLWNEAAESLFLIHSRLSEVHCRTLLAQARRSAQARRESEERLRLLIDSVSDYSIVMLDPAGTVASWNSSAVRINGFGSEEIVGRNFSCFYASEETAKGTPRQHLHIARTQARCEDEGWRVRKDGSRFLANVVINALHGDSAQLLGFVHVTRDITERKLADDRLRETEQELHRRLREQAAVAELGKRAVADIEPAALMREAVVTLASTLGIEYCLVLKLLPDGGGPVILEEFGWSDGATGSWRREEPNSEAGYVLLTREPLVIEDLRDERRFIPSDTLLTNRVTSGILVLIPGNAYPFGVLGAYTRAKRTFRSEEVSFVKAVANIIAEAAERTRAEEELKSREQFYRYLIDSSSDVIVALDERGSLLFLSNSVEKVFGYNPDDLTGRSSFDWVHPDDLPIAVSALAQALESPSIPHTIEVRARRPDGSWTPYEVVGKSLQPMSGMPRVIINIRDISERKLAQKEIATARDAALESSRLKSAFIANMSHEIRTPVNVIVGCTEAIADYLDSKGDTTQKCYLEAAARAGQRLVATVQSILDISKIEVGTFECAPTELELGSILTRVCDELVVFAKRKGLAFSTTIDEPLVTVVFDEYCLVHALANLLDNAIKFTGHGGVTVRLYRDPQGLLCIDISDTGTGIADEFLPKLFEQFSQQQVGNSRPFEGSGLGLALTRRYLELNGAWITVQSERDKGSTFTIYFSRESESPTTIAPS